MSSVIEIFKAGTRKDANGIEVTISREDLQTVVDNYAAEFHEAPLVIGHPKMDGPAYGWVEKLVLDGDVLKAQTKLVDSEFAELVNTGKFRKISAAFYRPNGESNPKPEGFYLRHVGFLGAMPPAVKGLKDPIFHDNADDVIEFSEWTQASLFQRLRDFFISQFGLEKADDVLPAWQINSLQEEAVRESLKPEPSYAPQFTEDNSDNNQSIGENLMTPEEIEAMKQENAKLKAEKDAAEKANAAALRAAEQADNAQFAESLVAEGKLLPKQKDAALALLNAEHGSVEFSESQFKDNLKAFLTGLPKAIEFSEVATKENGASAADDSVEYAEGTDPRSIEVDKQVRAYMKAHNVDYTTAFNLTQQ